MVLAAVVAVCTAGVACRQYLTLESLVAHEQLVRQAIRDHPGPALVVAFVVYVVASLVPGTSGKSLVYGWLWGLWWGAVLVNVALTTAATVTFLFSRHVFRDALWSWFGYGLERLNREFEREGAFYLLVLRLIHAPYTFVNYAMGATTIRTRTFWWASQLGMLPGNLIFVYAGSQLPSLQAVVRSGLRGLVSCELLAALVVLAAFPLVVRRLARWLWDWRERKPRRGRPPLAVARDGADHRCH